MKKAPIAILITIIIVLLIILQFKGCGNKSAVVQPEIKYEILEKKTDTIHDTVKVFHTELKPVYIDTSKVDTLYLPAGDYPIITFGYKIKDSLFDGTIIVKSPFKPEVDFKYTLTNKTVKESTVVEKIDKNYRGFLYGGGVTISPLLNELSIGVGYQTKQGDLFELDFGRNFNDKYNVLRFGFKKRF